MESLFFHFFVIRFDVFYSIFAPATPSVSKTYPFPLVALAI